MAAAVVARQRARRRGVVGLFSLTSATPACLVLASNQLPEPGSKPRPSIFSAWGHDRCLEACCLDQDSNQTCPGQSSRRCRTRRQPVARGSDGGTAHPDRAWQEAGVSRAHSQPRGARAGHSRPSWHLRLEAHSCCSPAPLVAQPTPRGAQPKRSSRRSIRQAAAQPRSSPRR